MTRAKTLAVLTAIVAQGVVGLAFAQGEPAQPGPDLFPPEATPQAAPPTVKVLTMEEADKLMAEMDDLAAKVEKLYAKARNKGDALKILCVNDKLTKLKKVRVEAGPMKAGIGKPETQQKASGDLHGAKTKIVKLHADAMVCVGEGPDGTIVITEKGTISEEGKGGEGPEQGTGDTGTGTGFGGLPADPFVSNPPVVKSPTG